MRRLLLLVVVLILVGGAVYVSTSKNSRPSPEPAKPLTIDALAPDFTLEDTHGNQVTLADLRGKVVLVNFWATWCPPCRAEMPSMEKLHIAMAGDDFVMLAINVEENGRTTVPEFLKVAAHSFTILYDEQAIVQELYGVYQFPESFVIRKDGVVAEKIVGAIDWAHPDTVAYFKGLAKE